MDNDFLEKGMDLYFAAAMMSPRDLWSIYSIPEARNLGKRPRHDTPFIRLLPFQKLAISTRDLAMA